MFQIPYMRPHITSTHTLSQFSALAPGDIVLTMSPTTRAMNKLAYTSLFWLSNWRSREKKEKKETLLYLHYHEIISASSCGFYPFKFSAFFFPASISICFFTCRYTGFVCDISTAVCNEVCLGTECTEY